MGSINIANSSTSKYEVYNFVFRFCFLCFLIFFPCISVPGMFYLLRVPSSVQQPSATLSASTYFVFYSTVRVLSACLCHLYPTPYLYRNSFVSFIRVVFFFSLLLFLG